MFRADNRVVREFAIVVNPRPHHLAPAGAGSLPPIGQLLIALAALVLGVRAMSSILASRKHGEPGARARSPRRSPLRGLSAGGRHPVLHAMPRRRGG